MMHHLHSLIHLEPANTVGRKEITSEYQEKTMKLLMVALRRIDFWEWGMDQIKKLSQF